MKMNMFFIAVILIFIGCLSLSSALKNPAAVYCTEMGYDYKIEQTGYGESGFCYFSSSERCPGFDFLYGTCGENYSYCNVHGLKQKTLEKCKNLRFLKRCAACMKDGKEIEVTELMNLSLKEKICGDGICEAGEKCNKDCKEKEVRSLNIFERILEFFKDLF